ncbi:MAG: hypothetical protein Q9191_003152 [Dirinaria sp. TL-2023a]
MADAPPAGAGAQCSTRTWYRGARSIVDSMVMVDVGTHHFVKSSEKSETVLVPQPSDDPHDPLAMIPLSLAPMFPELIKSFDSNLPDVIQFTGVSILVLGFSNFIWYANLLNSSATGRLIKDFKGTAQHFFRPSTCLLGVYLDMLRQHHLES